MTVAVCLLATTLGIGSRVHPHGRAHRWRPRRAGWRLLQWAGRHGGAHASVGCQAAWAPAACRPYGDRLPRLQRFSRLSHRCRANPGGGLPRAGGPFLAVSKHRRRPPALSGPRRHSHAQVHRYNQGSLGPFHHFRVRDRSVWLRRRRTHEDRWHESRGGLRNWRPVIWDSRIVRDGRRRRRRPAGIPRNRRIDRGRRDSWIIRDGRRRRRPTGIPRSRRIDRGRRGRRIVRGRRG